MPRAGRSTRRRRRSSDVDESKIRSRGRPRRPPSGGFSEAEAEMLARETARELESRLGLEGVISGEKLADIVREIVDSIFESRSTKPSLEYVLKRILAGPHAFLKAVAARLVEEIDTLDPGQLEFIVANAPELAGRAAPTLYRRAVEVGAHHVVDSLRHLWNIYGSPTPIKCPRCGFMAVTPTLTCMVCGAVLDEREVKDSIGFKELLKDFAERADPSFVDEVLKAGFVLVDHEVNPPSLRSKLEFYIELYLTREEKEFLKATFRKRLAGGKA